MRIDAIIHGLRLLAKRKKAENAILPDGFPVDSQLVFEETLLREAADMLETHQEGGCAAASEAQPNEPLTLEELKQMYCQAVWVGYRDGCHGSWGLVEIDEITLPSGAFCTIREDDFGLGWKAYRRPPKED